MGRETRKLPLNHYVIRAGVRGCGARLVRGCFLHRTTCLSWRTARVQHSTASLPAVFVGLCGAVQHRAASCNAVQRRAAPCSVVQSGQSRMCRAASIRRHRANASIILYCVSSRAGGTGLYGWVGRGRKFGTDCVCWYAIHTYKNMLCYLRMGLQYGTVLHCMELWHVGVTTCCICCECGCMTCCCTHV